MLKYLCQHFIEYGLYIVRKDRRRNYTMQKINISCGSVNVLLATNSNEIVNFFLYNRESVRETIPGVEVNRVDDCLEMKEPYIVYMDSSENEVRIDEKTNTAIISFQSQNYSSQTWYI